MSETAMTQDKTEPSEGHQEHPLGIYIVVWILLFVLSTFSYMVDILEFHGLLRWFLIVLFMLLKASLIVSIFMHMAWERLALIFAILLPPLCVTVFLSFMATEGDHTYLTRLSVFGQAAQVEPPHH